MRKVQQLMKKFGITKEKMAKRKKSMTVKLAKKNNRKVMLASKAKRRK